MKKNTKVWLLAFFTFPTVVMLVAIVVALAISVPKLIANQKRIDEMEKSFDESPDLSRPIKFSQLVDEAKDLAAITKYRAEMAKLSVVAKRPRPKPKYIPGASCLTGLPKSCKIGAWSKPNYYNQQRCVPTHACVPNEDCTNGIDDDLDGIADCADADCADMVACSPVEICKDGIDNDGNGFADCYDDECSREPHCKPKAPKKP